MNKLIVKKLFAKKLWKSLLALSLISISGVTLSEDIELYVSDAVKQAGKKIKVLIIFDNSGSMNDLHTVSEDFDPLETYDPVGSSHAYNDSATYFNVGGADSSTTIPDSPSDARRFLAEINSCESSKAILEEFGFYTGHIREYGYSGNTGSWKELPENNGLNIEVLDCEDDITNADPTNIASLLPGYPIDAEGSKQNPVYHTTTLADAKMDWTGNYVTLYTAKYLRWYHGQSVGEETESKLETAQNSISTVINTTPFVEFGMEIFNYDKGDSSTDGNGGRVVFGVKEMNDTNKANLLDLINNEVTGETWTPLCESVYEASQYYGGNLVDFGDDDIDVGSGQDKYNKNTPPRDTTIETGGKYITPFDDCASSVSHIILITDGEPTNDHAADSTILAMKSMVQTLDADGEPVFDEDGDPVLEEVAFNDASLDFDNTQYTPDGSNSYLPALAGWMSSFDVNQNLDGVQTVYTHTIGFGDGALAATGLLEATAERGKGKYFFADDNLSLTKALINILTPLPIANENLTSASVSANNFDQTQTLDSVYYAMFNPENGPRWQGNLKKYKMVNGDQVGFNGLLAVDEDTGDFSINVQSYWSTSVDGNKVEQGGVAEWYASNDVDDRRLLMEGGAGGVLQEFNRTNLQTAFTDQSGLATELGVAGLLDEEGNSIESAAIDELINWAKGMDVDDEDKDNLKDDMRSDVFADPLHSKPLVVNYGNSIRIVVGTNAGALHMFQDNGNAVIENWAFMPKEFTDNIKILRDNYSTADKVYGIDGEITAHFNDIDGDGTVNGADTMWIFFGLRRGGTSYYALDITTPGSPKLMWHIDENSSGFSGLGQSWSKPKIGYSKLNVSGNVASPVLFLGGGYDTSKDASGPGGDDNSGTGIYMVDAKTGTLKWSMEASGGTLTYPGTDSIPSSIGILDSTGNGLTDRLYVGDTGGNIWRVDMPSGDTDDFSVFKLASLGGDTNLTDRRFFYEPTIVRALISEVIETIVNDAEGNAETVRVHQVIPYDAVLIGSGDRSNPLGTDTKDSLFMIKDIHITTQTFSGSAIPETISETDLYNHTTNDFKDFEALGNITNPTTEQAADLANLEAKQVTLSEKSGWYIDLEQSGEKNSAAGLVINNVVYFTSYTPPAFGAPLVACQPPRGAGSIYAVDLTFGVKRHTKENMRDSDERIVEIGDEWLGSPTLIVLPTNPNNTGPADAEGDIIVGRTPFDVDFTLSTNRTYLYTTENQ